MKRTFEDFNKAREAVEAAETLKVAYTLRKEKRKIKSRINGLFYHQPFYVLTIDVDEGNQDES